MDNLMKIILVVLVAFLLLNYSCSKKEDFAKRRKKKCNKKCIKKIKKCLKNNFKGKKCNTNENKIIKKCKVPVNALTKKQINSLESYFSKVCVKRKKKRKKKDSYKRKEVVELDKRKDVVELDKRKEVVELDNNPNLVYFAIYKPTPYSRNYTFYDNLQFESNGILRNKSDTIDILSSCKTRYCKAVKGRSRIEWELYKGEEIEKNGKYLYKDYASNYKTAHDPNIKDGYFELNKKITHKGYDYYIGKSKFYGGSDEIFLITTRPAELFGFFLKDLRGNNKLHIRSTIIGDLYNEINKANPSVKALDDIFSSK